MKLPSRILTVLTAGSIACDLVLIPIGAAIAASPAAAATTGSVSLNSTPSPLLDSRINKAVTECAKAWAGKAGIRGFGAVVDALQGNTLGALRGSIIALQDKALRDVYNNFIQIPIC